MSKATLMVRFKRPTDSGWLRRPAVYGSTGRVVSGMAEFKDSKTGKKWTEKIGENYSFEIRIENNGTTYKPAGKIGADAEAQRVQAAAMFQAQKQAEAVGLEVIDPAVEGKKKKKPRLADAFDDYIEYEFKRGALEAREQAVLVKAEFLKFVPLTFVAEESSQLT